MTNEVTVNNQHKDRLFRFLFREKMALLALYNAVNGTEYDNPEDLTINTLEDVLLMGMKNDVSFLIGNTMNLYEHQSTYNRNMPLRGLFYISDLLRGYVESEKLDIYSSSQIHIPFPRYVVFYNGERNRPDREVLKLSDAFYPQGEEPVMELICILLNINKGHNKELLEKCPLLGEYATLISYIREYTGKGYRLEEAIKRAMDRCIEEHVLEDFLRKHREEIFHMLLKESDWTLHEESEQKLWYARGKESGLSQGLSRGLSQGLAAGLVQSIEALMKNLGWSLDEACAANDTTVEAYQRAKDMIAKNEESAETENISCQNKRANTCT